MEKSGPRIGTVDDAQTDCQGAAMRTPLTFTHPALDRSAHRRHDDAWLSDKFHDPATQFVVVYERTLLMRSDYDNQPIAATLTRNALPFDVVNVFSQSILLGLDENDVATICLRPDSKSVASFDYPDAAFYDLRTIGAALPGSDASIAAYACALDHWHSETRFCSLCGSETAVREAGHVRRCLNNDCARDHFPRIDPAVIVRIIHKDPTGDPAKDRILLARQANWPEGRYSVLAGFTEPGESLEQTVEREMFEEAGVRVTDIRYIESQPWPLPRSLMIGFEAIAIDDALDLTDDELADAHWLTRADLRVWEAEGKILSSKISISYRLIREWLEAE